MKAMIFDMDGTLADVRSIAHHFQHDLEEDKDYDAYHLESVQVPVVDWVAAAARQAHKDGYKVLILTARKIKYLEYTKAFLTKHNIEYDMLFMREDDDNRPDHEYKRDGLLYTRDFGYEIERAYEDNPEIIALWESEGIETVHVQDRGFDYISKEVDIRMNRQSPRDPWNEFFKIFMRNTNYHGVPQLKLAEEVEEFLTATDRYERLQEAADVIIVVGTQMYAEGWNFNDVLNAVYEKLEINIHRTWNLNPDGTISHIKER